MSSSDRWLDYVFTKPSFNSEGSETRAIAFSLGSTLHIITLDSPIIFQIKTSKTAFPRLKTYNTFGCNRQGTEKTLGELTLSSSSIHMCTSLQQKRKHSWLSRSVGSCKKEPNCGLGQDVWKTNHAKSSLFPCLETPCTRLDTRCTRLEPRFRGSRIESRSSSFEWLSTYICTLLYAYHTQVIHMRMLSYAYVLPLLFIAIPLLYVALSCTQHEIRVIWKCEWWQDYRSTCLEPRFGKLEWHEHGNRVSYFEACSFRKFNDKKPYYRMLFFVKLILWEKKNSLWIDITCWKNVNNKLPARFAARLLNKFEDKERRLPYFETWLAFTGNDSTTSRLIFSFSETYLVRKYLLAHSFTLPVETALNKHDHKYT